jgi:hypothetical protein
MTWIAGTTLSDERISSTRFASGAVKKDATSFSSQISVWTELVNDYSHDQEREPCICNSAFASACRWSYSRPRVYSSTTLMLVHFAEQGREKGPQSDLGGLFN